MAEWQKGRGNMESNLGNTFGRHREIVVVVMTTPSSPRLGRLWSKVETSG
jgi:hypothetical protein